MRSLLSFHILCFTNILVPLATILLFCPSPGSALSEADLGKGSRTYFHGGANTEDDLEECQDNYSPCSVIQNPFFYPFKVKHFCRCKKKRCPDKFEVPSKGVRRSLDTIFINNREQIKFCQELPKCHGGWGILRVGGEDNVPYHLNCYCPHKRRYWRLMDPDESPDSKEETSIVLDEHIKQNRDETSKSIRTQRPAQGNNGSQPIVVTAIPTKLFKCEKMDPCETSSCGTIRTDLYSTYQNCTCVPNAMCLPIGGLTSINEVMNSNGVGKIAKCITRPRPLPSKQKT